MTPADLRAWRVRLGYSQAQAARALGMELRGYRRLENGERGISRRTELACAWVERHGLELPREQERTT